MSRAVNCEQNSSLKRASHDQSDKSYMDTIPGQSCALHKHDTKHRGIHILGAIQQRPKHDIDHTLL